MNRPCNMDCAMHYKKGVTKNTEYFQSVTQETLSFLRIQGITLWAVSNAKRQSSKLKIHGTLKSFVSFPKATIVKKRKKKDAIVPLYSIKQNMLETENKL